MAAGFILTYEGFKLHIRAVSIDQTHDTVCIMIFDPCIYTHLIVSEDNIGKLNQCEWISRLRIWRACQSDGLLTAGVPHST